jgi:hypothetical protein
MLVTAAMLEVLEVLSEFLPAAIVIRIQFHGVNKEHTDANDVKSSQNYYCIFT